MKPAVTVTVEWGDQDHSLSLTARSWRRIKLGRPLTIRGKGYNYEGTFYWDYWTFEGGLAGEMRVGYGEDAAEGFVGTLREARIVEHSKP
jgi:hypothetical protein